MSLIGLPVAKASNGSALDNALSTRQLVEESLSLWQLLLTQYHVEADVKQHNNVRLDAAKINQKVSPQLNPRYGAIHMPSKIFDIRALVELTDIRKTVLDDASITPCPPFQQRLFFFRRFSLGYREKFVRWELLKASMLNGIHRAGVLEDKRAGRELIVPLKVSHVQTLIPDSYNIRMSMLNDRSHVSRVLALYEVLTLTRGPITRCVYYGLYRCFVKCMLLHLSEVDIHRLITLDAVVDCAEQRKREAASASLRGAEDSRRMSRTTGNAPSGWAMKDTTSLGTTRARSVSVCVPALVSENGDEVGENEIQSPSGSPSDNSLRRRSSVRSIATMRSWLQANKSDDPNDDELDPVALTSIDFVRFVSSLVMIWLETHAISDVANFVDYLGHLWVSEASVIDIEFANRFVSPIVECASLVPLVPGYATLFDEALLTYAKKQFVLSIHVRFPQFMSDGQHRHHASKTGAAGNSGEADGSKKAKARRGSMLNNQRGWNFVVSHQLQTESARTPQFVVDEGSSPQSPQDASLEANERRKASNTKHAKCEVGNSHLPHPHHHMLDPIVTANRPLATVCTPSQLNSSKFAPTIRSIAYLSHIPRKVAERMYAVDNSPLVGGLTRTERDLKNLFPPVVVAPPPPMLIAPSWAFGQAPSAFPTSDSEPKDDYEEAEPEEEENVIPSVSNDDELLSRYAEVARLRSRGIKKGEPRRSLSVDVMQTQISTELVSGNMARWVPVRHRPQFFSPTAKSVPKYTLR